MIKWLCVQHEYEIERLSAVANNNNNKNNGYNRNTKKRAVPSSSEQWLCVWFLCFVQHIG